MVASFANATATCGLEMLTETPFYFSPTPSIIPGFQDKYLSLLLPVIIYWVASLFYHTLDTIRLPFTEKYRLHEPEEITKRNRVSLKRVIVMVTVQQVIQTVLGYLVLEDEQTVLRETFADHQAKILSLSHHLRSYTAALIGLEWQPTVTRLVFSHQDANKAAWWLYWWGIPVAQFWFAFFVMDAWQYMLHRLFHESRWLYRNFHSHHHRLYVPYAFGALYNHPVEGLLLDSAGAAISHAASLMTVRQSIVLFTFSTLKTVSDHGGYAFPWYLDPLHLIFPNNAEYHDVHHQMTGLKYNYSQPFFVHFDALFGTRMSAAKFKKMREAIEARKAGKATAETPSEGEKDAAVDWIVSAEANPLLMTTKESYDLKAGTNTD